MAVHTRDLAIMFADISGSTRMYELLGDEVARARVAHCVAVLSRIAETHGGLTVKTIGDGIMCTFEQPVAAVTAACEMQRRLEEEAVELTDAGPLTLSIRIGLHVGPAILEEGDAFGDAVNVAARIGALAKPGQILTTRETVDQLPQGQRQNSRVIDHTPIRGKKATIDVHEILWQPEDVTWMSIPVTATSVEVPRLYLTYRDLELVMDEERPVIVLGRSRTVDLPVEEVLASRLHVRIEQRRGKYYLTDLSTNGTHVRSGDSLAFLRREEMPLPEAGDISLGRPFDEDPGELVHFETRSAA